MNVLLVYLALEAAAVHASDPVAECRAAHAADPPAHIACLERALRGQAQQGEQFGTEADVRTQPPGERAREIDVEIVATSYTGDRGVFQMADGGVWRETEKTPERLRLDPGTRYRARIERGTLGGYRMYVDGVRRMIKVDRVK
jgi:hypothetical protein